MAAQLVIQNIVLLAMAATVAYCWIRVLLLARSSDRAAGFGN